MIRGFATLYFLHKILESPQTTQLAKANSNYIIYILPCFYILFHFNFIHLHFNIFILKLITKEKDKEKSLMWWVNNYK